MTLLSSVLLLMLWGCGPLEHSEERTTEEFSAYAASAGSPTPGYKVYFGNTHSHTKFSDGKDNKVPRDHFALAKAEGFDFYMTSDHSLKKYENWTPANWQKTRTQANQATDASFVAIAGIEFSENKGPGGAGHLNVFNPVKTLDASDSGVNLPVFYDWLVGHDYIASFNHPANVHAVNGPLDFNNFGYQTSKRRKVVAMIELLKRKSDSLAKVTEALDKGWRVAPVGAMDNHTVDPISNSPLRTAVLAKTLTRASILGAMRARRVYATRDKNLRISYTVNGRIMGAILRGPSKLNFHIAVSDPNVGSAGNKITKIQILTEGGAVVKSKKFDAHSVTWKPVLTSQHSYYWLRVFLARRTDATAYAAPVWINPCTKQSHCDDGDPCTADQCQAGVCQHATVPNCCSKNAQCDDGDPCTQDRCQGNVCESSPVADCCVEPCDNTQPPEADAGPPPPEVDGGPYLEADSSLPDVQEGQKAPPASSDPPESSSPAAIYAERDHRLEGGCAVGAGSGASPAASIILLLLLILGRAKRKGSILRIVPFAVFLTALLFSCAGDVSNHLQDGGAIPLGDADNDATRGTDTICVPQCNGKCAGADDGCGQACPDDNCLGCCDGEAICHVCGADETCTSAGCVCAPPASLPDAVRNGALRKIYDEQMKSGVFPDFTATKYNNLGGTLAWGESYIMQSLLSMYEATGEATYLDKFVEHGDALIAKRDDQQGLPDWEGKLRRGWQAGGHYTLTERRSFPDRQGNPSIELQARRWAGNSDTTVEIKPGTNPGTFMIEATNNFRPADTGPLVETFDNLTLANVEQRLHENLLDKPLNALLRAWKAPGSTQNPAPTPNPASFEPQKVVLHGHHTGQIVLALAQFAAMVKEDTCLGHHYSQAAQRFVAAAAESMADFNDTWRQDPNDNKRGWYIFEPGIPFWCDGLVEPFNTNSASGRAHLYLYIATGDTHHLERARALAHNLKTRLLDVPCGDSNCYAWHYWFNEPFESWTEADGICTNTPRGPVEGKKSWEDISHGQLDLLFMAACQRYNQLRPQYDLVFTAQDMETLARTFNRRIWRPPGAGASLDGGVMQSFFIDPSDEVLNKQRGIYDNAVSGFTDLATIDSDPLIWRRLLFTFRHQIRRNSQKSTGSKLADIFGDNPVGTTFGVNVLGLAQLLTNQPHPLLPSFTGFVSNDVSPTDSPLTQFDYWGGIALDHNNRSIGLDLLRPTQVSRLELHSDGTANRVTADDLAIYVSDDNLSYTEYTGPRTTSLSPQKMVLSDLAITARYVKVRSMFGDTNHTFSNQILDIMRAYAE